MQNCPTLGRNWDLPILRDWARSQSNPQVWHLKSIVPLLKVYQDSEKNSLRSCFCFLNMSSKVLQTGNSLNFWAERQFCDWSAKELSPSWPSTQRSHHPMAFQVPTFRNICLHCYFWRTEILLHSQPCKATWGLDIWISHQSLSLRNFITL